MNFATDPVDQLAINTIRCLAADTVQKANSGHPGAPMGCAPMAHILFSRFLKYNPKNPSWFARDRFILSNGHGCALLYTLLHLAGYEGMSLEQLKNFRQWKSLTPGHPEADLTEGVEVTTGPLGQGICNAVGLAIAEAHLAATFNKPGFNLVDNYTYCIVGDGCLQEGVSSEASSLAGHLKLGKLIVLYDDNSISIDGETDISFTEDVVKRYEAYGWHVSTVANGNDDLEGLFKAIAEAKKVTDKPSLIAIKTIIGFGASIQGTEKTHGSPLGNDEIASVKRKFGMDPEVYFHTPDAVKHYYAAIASKGAEQEHHWKKLLESYCSKHPELGGELKRRIKGDLPSGWDNALPRYTPSDPAVATRKLSENVLNAIADKVPELVGGSADLTGSNLTRWKTAQDFQAVAEYGSYSGRYFRFGVREHGMAAICNGLFAYGGLIPFGATFLNFITYAWGAVRLSALSHFGVLYIMTHDSIGLGEDGPTHQPIEVLALCRATPNMLTFRPADGNEVSGCYKVALERRHTPSVLSLSRQNVPHLEGTTLEGVTKGAYVISDCETPQVILVGTGTEVSICVDVAKELAKQKVKARVVSMPCMELFEEQSFSYKESVFLKGVPVVSVEVQSSMPWYKYAHTIVGIDKFGASAPAKIIYKEYGFGVPEIVEKVNKTLKFFQGKPVPHLLCRPC